MKLTLASNNVGKLHEFRRLLPEMQLLTPRDLGLTFAYDECGETFLENAVGKARHLYEAAGTATVADDSGLVVPALNGAPGVRSARYGGKISQQQRNQLLLDALAGAADRSALFVCCVAVVLTDHRLLIVQETVEGMVVSVPQGEGGFGYDPVFQSHGAKATFAQLDNTAKDVISHRGRALRRCQKLLLQS